MAVRRQIEKYHHYTDVQGDPLYRVARTIPKDFFVERWDSGRARYVKGWGDVPHVLYNLPAVFGEATRGGTTWICEGERDADALIERGITATTNPGGAGKWNGKNAEGWAGALRGTGRVVICYDLDKPNPKTGKRPGEAHALEVEASIKNVVGGIEFRCAAEGKDISDHFDAGLGVSDLIDARPSATPTRAVASPENAAGERREWVTREHEPAVYQLALYKLREHAATNNLPAPRQTHNGFEACCMAHDDHKPSLGVSVGKTQRLVVKCHAGCTAKQIAAALGVDLAEYFDNGVGRQGAGNVKSDASSKKTWPIPLGEAAYHGPIGEFVRAIEQDTEADPAALLVQALACFGNAVGRYPHFMAEDSRHGTNLDVLIIGDTAAARKGTSLKRARRVIGLADPDWGDRNGGDGGLSSGEGLINAVRDAHGKVPGVKDKRLLATMGEFAETLTKMKRETNTLSSTLRNAWDGETLRVRTRGAPLTATNAHVSVIGHITQADIEKNLGAAEIWNGFANRFLWVAARKVRSLPFGGDVEQATNKLVPAIREALEWGQQRERRIEFTPAAHKRWGEVYVDLNDRQVPGLEHLLDRGAPQVRRLALIYAVIDKAEAVNLKHLAAALEVWRYSEATIEYLFSDMPAGREETIITRPLQKAAGEWVTLTVLSKLARKADIARPRRDAILRDMVEQGVIERREILTTGGRPRMEFRWV